MDNLTAGKRNEEFILWEASDQYCRENATLASGQNLKAGTILTGASTALTAAAATNTDDTLDAAATAILLHDADASGGALAVAILKRGPAVVKGDLLVYPAETTSNVETDANASLALLNIIVR